MVAEERTYDVACSAEREQSCVLELSPLMQAGQYSLALTLHELKAPRLCQSALGRPFGRPPLQNTATHWLLDWGQNASPRRMDARESLRWRFGACLKLVSAAACDSPPVRSQVRLQ